MNKIQEIPFKDIEKFIDIVADAYPGLQISAAEAKKRVKERWRKRRQDKRMSWWGMYRGSEMLGGMIYYDYTMNFFGHKVLTGGAGTVAVSLVHKKEHVARDLMRFFFRHYRKRGAPLAVLWPFRPDFYKKMGCGLGWKMDQYRLTPATLPRTKARKHVRHLGKADMKALNDCYNRFVDTRTGMIEETQVNRNIRYDLGKGVKYVGYVKDGRVLGYLIFTFARGNPENFVDNHIKIEEMVYESPEVLNGLLSFLHTQADQINRIIVSSNDEYFYHCFDDPRNETGNLMSPVYHESHRSGVGIMYRVLNTREVFNLLKDRDFDGVSVRLRLKVHDTFLKENNGDLTIHFVKGHPQIKTGRAAAEVSLGLDIADFSSLIMGAVDLRSLYNYGRAELSKATYLEPLNQLFATKQKPVCMTSF
ncbi:MAG: GNAT family N-acetyltransferase [Candidatus Zixiibacteriota bacterium]|nr:MAG: GNAT family N-acetyltransferase [candidate division Zixibacteria bacterium]